MKKSDLPDAAAREAALDPGRSFIVQAPAGSGKTELLVRRFLGLLGSVERPEEIVAITFTRKAAAEMRKRVLEAAPGAGELGHRLRIQTIDALCASLTRQMPVLARFGAQPELVENARPHYREAALRTLKALSPDAERLLAHLDNNLGTAVWLLSSMLAKRDQWLRTTALRAPGPSSRRASSWSARASSAPRAGSIRTRRWKWQTGGSPRKRSGEEGQQHPPRWSLLRACEKRW